MDADHVIWTWSLMDLPEGCARSRMAPSADAARSALCGNCSLLRTSRGLTHYYPGTLFVESCSGICAILWGQNHGLVTIDVLEGLLLRKLQAWRSPEGPAAEAG